MLQALTSIHLQCIGNDRYHFSCDEAFILRYLVSVPALHAASDTSSSPVCSLIIPGQVGKSSPPVVVLVQHAKYLSSCHYSKYKFRWRLRQGKDGEITRFHLLPIALATLGTNFLGPPAVQCRFRLCRENRDSHISGDRRMLY